jgi:hypothetical protein
MEVCDCQIRWIRWMQHPFALQIGHFLWHYFDGMTVWYRELSKYNNKLLQAISADFVKCSWLNRFNIWSMKYCAVKLSPCGGRSTITKQFGLENCEHWFLGPIVRQTRSESSLSRLNQHLFEKFFHTTQDSLPV